MNRRDLLDPRRLAHALGQVAAAVDDVAGESSESLRAPDDELALLRFGRRAMATGFEIALPLGTADALAAAEDALDLIDRLEAQLTVYRDDSDVSRINRHAAISPMPVETRLFELLELAARIHWDTDGAYDIAVGALIKSWGFYRRQGCVPDEAERLMSLNSSGTRHLDLNAERRTIYFRQSGVELNLGSIGKGYALDRVAERLRNQDNIQHALLHGGSSSVVGMGTPPGQSRGWPVGLGHPADLCRRMGVVWLKDRALGTSSATFQNLTHQGRKLGHILDPRTGWPALQLASASAIAPTAAQADALATAFFVLGTQPTRLYCEKHPDIGAVLLPPGHHVPVVCGNVDFVLTQ